MSSLENKKFDIFMKNFRTQISKLGFKNTIQKDYILKILFLVKNI
ncbi:hypothetical protein [Halarcobacter anaerophilus]|nr:hypothetical protein [Halarcobacter anaerophilus]